MTRFFIFTLVCIGLAGCQSSDAVLQQYQLAKAPTFSNVDLNAPHLLVNPVVLVDSLKRPNILLKQNENTLYVTKYHMWAEPLNQGISRAMVNHLNSNQTDWRVDHRLIRQCQKGRECLELTVLVESFYPTDQSTVEFAGKYKLTQHDTILTQQDFYLTSSLAHDGYPHAVSKLQQLIYTLSSQITQQLPSTK